MAGWSRTSTAFTWVSFATLGTAIGDATAAGAKRLKSLKDSKSGSSSC